MLTSEAVCHLSRTSPFGYNENDYGNSASMGLLEMDKQEEGWKASKMSMTTTTSQRSML